jgi:recombinational DNA repair protein (RecF pathway)
VAAGLAGVLVAVVVFVLAFLGVLGLAPALVAWAAGGGPARALGRWVAAGSVRRATFSAGAGGRLCGPCAREARAAGRRVGTLPADVLEQAERLLEGGAAAAAELTPEQLLRVRDFVVRFLEYHLQTRPKSYRALLPARAGPARRTAPT